jgi:hypothetical protein
MSTHTTTTNGNVTSPASPAAPKAARRKLRKPPVIDRPGVDAMDVPASPTPAAAPHAPAPASPPASGGTVGSTASTAGYDFPVNSPPVVTVPSAPNGFIPVSAIDLRGFRPMQSELASVPDAILELKKFANYTGLFGITAPPAAQVSQRLHVAAQWTSLLAQSTAWYTYVKSQEGMAWKDALELVAKLKTPFSSPPPATLPFSACTPRSPECLAPPRWSGSAPPRPARRTKR